MSKKAPSKANPDAPKGAPEADDLELGVDTIPGVDEPAEVEESDRDIDAPTEPTGNPATDIYIEGQGYQADKDASKKLFRMTISGAIFEHVSDRPDGCWVYRYIGR